MLDYLILSYITLHLSNIVFPKTLYFYFHSPSGPVYSSKHPPEWVMVLSVNYSSKYFQRNFTSSLHSTITTDRPPKFTIPMRKRTRQSLPQTREVDRRKARRKEGATQVLLLFHIFNGRKGPVSLLPPLRGTSLVRGRLGFYLSTSDLWISKYILWAIHDRPYMRIVRFFVLFRVNFMENPR